MNQSVTRLFNSVYRTAPATPGLLIIQGLGLSLIREGPEKGHPVGLRIKCGFFFIIIKKKSTMRYNPGYQRRKPTSCKY